MPNIDEMDPMPGVSVNEGNDGAIPLMSGFESWAASWHRPVGSSTPRPSWTVGTTPPGLTSTS